VKSFCQPITQTGDGITVSQTTEPTKVLFYSHDTFGLGHIRRTLSISDAVSKTLEKASVLVLTGSSAVHSLRIPQGVDYVKLPCVTKMGNGQYKSKFLRLDFEALLKLREELIFSTAATYSPDLVFVDNVPLGMKGEMVKTLRHLRDLRPETRTILTLRDVLDNPERMIADWEASSVYEAIELFYDRVLIYGSPEVFDIVAEYRLPPRVAAKVEYLGYIRHPTHEGASASIRRRFVPDGEKLVLVTVGGGGDGFEIISNYLTGLLSAEPDVPTHSLVVLGPDMSESSRASLQSRYGQNRRSTDRPRITLADCYGDLTDFIEAADVVVSMGGYNTMCEILSLSKQAVIVPRVKPRLEQWIRCRRLAELGLVRVVHPDEMTPQRLIDEVVQSLADQTLRSTGLLTFDGLDQACAIVGADCAMNRS